MLISGIVFICIFYHAEVEMNEETQKDIRSLLKSFGVKAHEAIDQHIASQASQSLIELRIVLEDKSSSEKLLAVEGEIHT
jgi:archaellum component FlaF (FlaF/FlaG flagellin family)